MYIFQDLTMHKRMRLTFHYSVAVIPCLILCDGIIMPNLNVKVKRKWIICLEAVFMVVFYKLSSFFNAFCSTAEKFVPSRSAIVFNHAGIVRVFLTALLLKNFRYSIVSQ